MDTDTRKLHIIEDVLKTNNVAVLARMESLLKQSNKPENKKGSLDNVFGVWTNEEADEISRLRAPRQLFLKEASD